MSIGRIASIPCSLFYLAALMGFAVLVSPFLLGLYVYRKRQWGRA